MTEGDEEKGEASSGQQLFNEKTFAGFLGVE